MPSSALSRLSTSISSSFYRAVSAKRSLPHYIVELRVGSSKPLCSSASTLSGDFPLRSHCSWRRKAMSVSASKTFSGDICKDGFVSSCGKSVDFTKPCSVFFCDNANRSFHRASLSLRRREPSNAHSVGEYSICNVSRRNGNTFSFIRSGLGNLQVVASAQYSGGAAQDVSLEGSSHDDLLPSPVGQDIAGGKVLKLLSGYCSLPHPDKEDKGGEDAHFVCEDEQAIGVADGVGGWADVGVDAGLFSRELMANSVNAIKEEPAGSIDPARVLEKAHASTNAKGSSTACIIALTKEGLHAINLGDSGFIVIRDGCTIFRSPVQQHGFNFTYQLESGNTGDLPSSGQVFTIPVIPGDVVVAGTDGLFDNLYNNEITAVVVDAVRSGLEPQAMAQKIAALARQRAMDRNRQTPFASAAQEAGYRYHGGKLDDITVVVSYVR
ncbi:hypothetical protein SAY86_013655 [Trapa natans]|uniref:Protein phosphatase n=1 Tax=Trapa natans TaxID=22666 RepID=A0AAN7KXQ3_TRANT|nr:hypothetical protein SAY86_013655 [Trapa natans]